MSVFDQELILPGVITDILSDYSTGYDTSLFGTTDSVAIVGTAFNGPVGVPVQIYSPEHARYVFGDVYDFKTKKEATLVAEIQDAWDRGCRTIYGVRVSGKEIYKDFELASDVKAKLRVSGMFPNNGNKSVYFEYDAIDTLAEMTDGSEPSIKIYKPANRATIEEKMQGKVVNENSILINTIKLGSSWNVGESTRLVDFIDLFNNYRYNNVLRLTIVDEEGNDITNTTLAQSLVFGEMLPGVYFVGRDKNHEKLIAKTEVNVQFLTGDEDTDMVPEGFAGNLLKTLVVNTDINAPYPIYHNDVLELNKLIGNVEGITMVSLFDFLEVAGKADILWKQDKIDYEEVVVNDFDMYKKLGSGFATTAKIIETKAGSGVYKVVEVTNANDENRVVAINDGIYSMLENLRCDYRVLTGKYADTAIKGILPKKDKFLIPSPISSLIFSEVINVTPKIKETDLSAVAKNYGFELISLDDTSELLSKDMVISQLYKEDSGEYPVFKFAISVDDIGALKAKANQLEEGDLVYDTVNKRLHRKAGNELIELIDKDLYKSEFVDSFVITEKNVLTIDDGELTLKFKNVEQKTDLNDAKYVIASTRGKNIIFEIGYAVDTFDTIKAVATLEDVLTESLTMFTAMVPKFDTDIINFASMRAINLDATTLEELIVLMNEDSTLSEKFSFNTGSTVSAAEKFLMVLPDVFADPGVGNKVVTSNSLIGNPKADDPIEDRTAPVYNKSLYIPFKTTDNFARHLAQHCTYTGLKTASTHGIIGCSKVLTSNLKAISDRVDSLVNLDLNLYAKKPNGNDMLDRNNMPYPIGRTISVTFFQHSVATGSNYNYVATGASAYAGMVSVLPIDQSSTAQPINLGGVSFELTNFQLGRLTQAGYVTVKNSYTQGYVITDGVTMAPATSPFRRLSVTRIINGIDKAIRAASEPFIGKQNHLANRNSLQTAIKSVLDKMLNNLIERYDFKLILDRAAERMGIIEIDYTIIPIYEIREVRNRISVKDRE